MHIVSVLLRRILFLEVFVSVIRLNKSFGVNHLVALKVAPKYAFGRGVFFPKKCWSNQFAFFFFKKIILRKKGRYICSWKKKLFEKGHFCEVSFPTFMLLLIRRKVTDLWKKLAHLKCAHLWKSAHLIVPIFEKSAHLMVLIDEQKQMGNSNYCGIMWIQSEMQNIII